MKNENKTNTYVKNQECSACEWHYALSQDDHFRLEIIGNALLGVAELTERLPLETDPEVSSTNLGSLFRVFAKEVGGVLTSTPLAQTAETKAA